MALVLVLVLVGGAGWRWRLSELAVDEVKELRWAPREVVTLIEWAARWERRTKQNSRWGGLAVASNR